MFKKLKQKISEEQAPPRGAGGRAAPLPPQVPSKSPPPNVNRSRISSFTDQNDEGTLTPDKEEKTPAFLFLMQSIGVTYSWIHSTASVA